MDNKNTPSFLEAFFGSLFSFKEYPRFAERSLWSAHLHLMLALVLVVSLMSFAASAWFHYQLGPVLDEVVKQVPEVRVVDGRAQVDLPQPHVYEVEGEPIVILDTTGPAEAHLEGREALIVLTETDLVIKEQNGEVTYYELAEFGENFELSSTTVEGWIQVAKTWTMPLLFLVMMSWFLIWKPVQVLAVAGVITLLNGSRPNFSTHLKLACYAILPALAWSLITLVAALLGHSVPFASLVYWLILAGVTYQGASLIKNTPYHQ